MTGIGLHGENLIFLISQPRAGSTLLQRILGSHPEIHTLSEPWVMLHPLYALRSEGYTAEYGASKAHTALRTFLQALPQEEEEYVQGLRRMLSHLYSQALAGSGRRLFLDKTPRYYLVISDLVRVFPQARFILMLRNPMAVLASIVSAWTTWSWLTLFKYKQDLLQAPALLLEGIDLLGENAIVVRYEHLVQEPESEVRRICEGLALDFAPEMLEYGQHDLPKWRLGDQEGVYRQMRPVAQSVEKWLEALDDPQVWRLARDYLQVLGPATIRRLGYIYGEMRQALADRRPGPLARWRTLSLAWLMQKPAQERSLWTRGLVWLLRSLQRDGVWHTAVAGAEKVSHAHSDSD
jgi:hypothetical protein